MAAFSHCRPDKLALAFRMTVCHNSGRSPPRTHGSTSTQIMNGTSETRTQVQIISNSDCCHEWNSFCWVASAATLSHRQSIKIPFRCLWLLLSPSDRSWALWRDIRNLLHFLVIWTPFLPFSSIISQTSSILAFDHTWLRGASLAGLFAKNPASPFECTYELTGRVILSLDVGPRVPHITPSILVTTV